MPTGTKREMSVRLARARATAVRLGQRDYIGTLHLLGRLEYMGLRRRIPALMHLASQLRTSMIQACVPPRREL